MSTTAQRTKITTEQNEFSTPTLVTGVVAGIDTDGLVLVKWKSDAIGTLSILACELLLTGIENPPYKEGDRVIVLMPTAEQVIPCILGTVGRMVADHRMLVPGVKPHYPTRLKADEIEITAEEKLVVQCEEGSVTMHQDGTVAVRGTRILSRAKGVNKIKGGSVQLN